MTIINNNNNDNNNNNNKNNNNNNNNKKIIIVITITIIITILITVNVISYAPFVRVFGWKVEKHVFFILSVNFFLFFREKIVLSAE